MEPIPDSPQERDEKARVVEAARVKAAAELATDTAAKAEVLREERERDALATKADLITIRRENRIFYTLAFVAIAVSAIAN